jgi:NADH-quinone oxidoreductase subunit J
MTVFGIIFYLMAILIIVATICAVTAAAPVHSVIYLICSFFGTALLFYLLGAPLLAAFEVIIYAGAIMVLFLFVIMTIKGAQPPEQQHFFRWLPYLTIVALLFIVSAFLICNAPVTGAILTPALAEPREFGRFLFQKYWFPVEIVSFLLLVALVGALYLGRPVEKENTDSSARVS